MSATTTYQTAHSRELVEHHELEHGVQHAQSKGKQCVGCVGAHGGEDDDIHAGREDITNNSCMQQHTCACPPRMPTPREHRLLHRPRYMAPLSVQIERGRTGYWHRRAGQHMGDGWGSGGAGGHVEQEQW
ncbi:hypothetical protein K438DRAFT_1787194 [Mycena galopus ATCC 62051]|nr:hypothetical protein K438DRAFT_1787194 [Mycena galopus ATCC 62051]